MAVLVNKNTKVICQGFTGAHGTFHSEQALAYGTQMVGGVTPGKGGHEASRLPVFNTVAEAVTKTGANAIVIYVPPPFAADCDPGSDRRRHAADRLHHRGHPGARHGAGQARARRLEIAPDRPELPGRHHARRMQDRHHARPYPQARQDRHRLALRHAHLRSRGADHGGGLGQSTCVGIGGDPVNGTDFIDVPGDVPGRTRRPRRSS